MPRQGCAHAYQDVGGGADASCPRRRAVCAAGALPAASNQRLQAWGVQATGDAATRHEPPQGEVEAPTSCRVSGLCPVHLLAEATAAPMPAGHPGHRWLCCHTLCLQAFCRQDAANLRKLVWSGGCDALLGVLQSRELWSLFFVLQVPPRTRTALTFCGAQ